MHVRFSRASNTEDFKLIQELYVSAFPWQERRSEQGLAMQLHTTGCHVEMIYHDEAYAGFCIWWQLDGFAFLEHFAVNPLMRGKKIGEKVMQKLRQTTRGPLLFEIEPPLEGDARRRLDFYLRNGFYLLQKPYIQPSYHQAQDLEMKLMCSEESPDENLLDDWIRQIKRDVYNVLHP